MTKPELITAMAEKSELTKKDAETLLKAFQDVVGETLSKGEEVNLIGFGKFKTTVREARDCRNPKTSEIVHVESKKAPKFTFSKVVKDGINQ